MHRNSHSIPNRSKETLLSESNGAVIVLLVATLLTLFAILAYAVDLGAARYHQRQMQNSVDNAAISAARFFAQPICDPSDPSYPSGCAATVLNEVRDIGRANGLVDNEFLASAQVGLWDSVTKSFTANATPINAVSVPARRNVGNFFASVFTGTNLVPAVNAIAVSGSPNSAYCAIPFGIDDDLLVGKNYGDIITVRNQSPGNWGKLDIGGNMSSGNNFEDAMKYGLCNYPLSIGDHISPGTGFAGVNNGFDERFTVNPRVIIPIVDHFPNGNSENVTIMGFIVADMIAQNESGNNWNGELKFVDVAAGFGIGGNNGVPPYAKTIALVK